MCEWAQQLWMVATFEPKFQDDWCEQMKNGFKALCSISKVNFFLASIMYVYNKQEILFGVTQATNF